MPQPVAPAVERVEIAAEQWVLDLSEVLRALEMTFGDIGRVVRAVDENVVPGGVPGRPRPRNDCVPLIASSELEIDPIDHTTIGEAKMLDDLAGSKARHGNFLFGSQRSFEHGGMPESRLPPPEDPIMKTLEELRRDVTAFVEERQWQRFHSPKNLAMALTVEASELQEHFQWLTAEESDALDEETLAAVADEIADVQVYLVRLADRLGIDLLAACEQKMTKNRAKYPADLARGRADKYTRYQSE